MLAVFPSPLTICTLTPETWIVGLPPIPVAWYFMCARIVACSSEGSADFAYPVLQTPPLGVTTGLPSFSGTHTCNPAANPPLAITSSTPTATHTATAILRRALSTRITHPPSPEVRANLSVARVRVVYQPMARPV